VETFWHFVFGIIVVGGMVGGMVGGAYTISMMHNLEK
jgi:hypothetical protein